MARIGWRSIGPHFEKSGSTTAGSAPPPPDCEVMTCLPWARTSSAEIRPPGPVPLTAWMSSPSCRARRRTDGAAGATGRVSGAAAGPAAAAAAAGREPREKSTSSPGPLPFGLASPVLPPKLGAGAAGSGLAFAGAGAQAAGDAPRRGRSRPDRS